MRKVRSSARRTAGAARVAAAVASDPLRKRRRSTVGKVMLFLLEFIRWAAKSVETQNHAIHAPRLDQRDGFVDAFESPYFADQRFEVEQAMLDEAQRLGEIDHRSC